MWERDVRYFPCSVATCLKVAPYTSLSSFPASLRHVISNPCLAIREALGPRELMPVALR